VRSGKSGTIATEAPQAPTLTYWKCGEETKDKFPNKKSKKWLLTPKRLRPWNDNRNKEGTNCAKMQRLV